MQPLQREGQPVRGDEPLRPRQGEPLRSESLRAGQGQPLRREPLRRRVSTPDDNRAARTARSRDALATLSEVMRVTARSGGLVAELLRASGRADGFSVWEHLPEGDVTDPDGLYQWYYHAHPVDEATPGPHDAEHGHFHLFARDGERMTHLVGIGMDAGGAPLSLFTTNAWVTGEHWRPAGETALLTAGFAVDDVRPSWPVNLWLGAIMQLYTDEVAALLAERDAVIAARADPRAALEDRALEVLSARPIDLVAKAEALGL